MKNKPSLLPSAIIHLKLPLMLLRVIILSILFLISTPSTLASSTPIIITEVTQFDIDGDGVISLTVVDCVFATEHDRVLIYDQNRNMLTGNRWEEITDFQNDIWIFDVGADGTAQLIIDFEVEGDKYIALVYDDIDENGEVAYRTLGGQVIIEESSYWHVKVESSQAWTHAGDQFNPQLTYFVDGYEGLGQGVGNTGMTTQEAGYDGIVDWQLNIGDGDYDGINDYQLQRAISPILVQRSNPALHKSVIFSQVISRQPTVYTDTVFWSLLIGKHPYEDYRYFDHTPVIAVDWERGIIDRIGILGFPIEEGYHIFSRLPLEKHTTNTVNFENPMAYFDMANDQDGWPELQVRFDAAVPYDPYFPFPYQGTIESPNLEVNYSWDQDNDNRWDYKINLGANYPLDEVVEFPDFAIKSVPYDTLVPWVKNHTWDVAMLVFDGRPSSDSEGMFGKGWMMFRGYADGESIEPSGVKNEFLMGFSDLPPTENYQDIQVGMRGEYSFQYFATPRIYLSVLDRQLHLLGAQSGIWNLDEDHYLRYANLDGDAYLDQWQEEHNGIVVQQVNYSHGFFVYIGNNNVLLKQTNIPPALIESQPPGNYEEWQNLDAQLRLSQTASSPNDFLSLLDEISGPEMHIQGATLRDFRPTPQGFRFILELPSGYIARSDLENLGSLPETAGNYLVEYDGNEWSIRIATPPSLHVTDFQLNPYDSEMHALEWVAVEAIVRNDGLEDVDDLLICTTFDGPDGQQLVMTDTVALIPGGGERSIGWQWSPETDGNWTIVVATNCAESESGEGQGEILLREAVTLTYGRPTSQQWLLTLGGGVSPMIAVLFVLLAGLSGTLGILWYRESQVMAEESSTNLSANHQRSN